MVRAKIPNCSLFPCSVPHGFPLRFLPQLDVPLPLDSVLPGNLLHRIFFFLFKLDTKFCCCFMFAAVWVSFCLSCHCFYFFSLSFFCTIWWCSFPICQFHSHNWPILMILVQNGLLCFKSKRIQYWFADLNFLTSLDYHTSQQTYQTHDPAPCYWSWISTVPSPNTPI